MTATYTIEIRTVCGEPMLDARAVALLVGVRPEDVTALPVVNGAMRLPRHWLQQGRRRTREAAAHTGSSAFEDVLSYWARRDHNAELEVRYP